MQRQPTVAEHDVTLNLSGDRLSYQKGTQEKACKVMYKEQHEGEPWTLKDE